MPVDLKTPLCVAVSSSALFDLSESHAIFSDINLTPRQRLAAYQAHVAERQQKNPDFIPQPGVAMALIQGLLALNEHKDAQIAASPWRQRVVEVHIVSRNNAITGAEILRWTHAYGLDAVRFVFTNGASAVPSLAALHTDMFISTSLSDVRDALTQGIAAAHVDSAKGKVLQPGEQLRFGFDFDGVLAGWHSEKAFQGSGFDLGAYQAHEARFVNKPLKQGPFAALALKLAAIRDHFDVHAFETGMRPDGGPDIRLPLSLELVTARGGSSPAGPGKSGKWPASTLGKEVPQRARNTLKAWGLVFDRESWLGGAEKTDLIRGCHFFVDDQKAHLSRLAGIVPAGHVPLPDSFANSRYIKYRGHGVIVQPGLEASSARRFKPAPS